MFVVAALALGVYVMLWAIIRIFEGSVDDRD